MDEQSIAWGRMRAGPGDRKVCVDHLQKDMVSNHVVFFVNQYGFLVLNRTIIAKEMERERSFKMHIVNYLQWMLELVCVVFFSPC